MRSAFRHLKKVDPALAAVIERVGPCRLTLVKDGSHFDHVVRCIVYQQLSGKAAATIHGRLLAMFGGRRPTPAQLVRARVPALRAVGLSGRKVEYIQELARRTMTGELPIERIHTMGGDEVIDTLTSIRGIGRWTAQMVLMFRLGHPDVFPELDLGIQKAVQKLHRMRKLPTPQKMEKIGARWAPYRSVATWYLWRSLDVAG